MTKKKQEKTDFHLELPTDLHKKFKSKVAQQGTNMTTKIKQWIKNYVANNKTEPKISDDNSTKGFPQEDMGTQ